MRRLLSPRWLAKHVAMIVLVAAFLSLGWWQVSRARSGNTLSFAYALEWPLFALFVIGIWAREVRATLRPAPGRPAPGRPAPGQTATSAAPPRVDADRRGVRRPVIVPVSPPRPDEPADPALTAYNDYLAWLGADPRRRPADYRPAPLGE